jgi:hypothetical protein
MEPHLNYVGLAICDACLDGEGGECHTPGCALWLSTAPDIPIRNMAAFLTSKQFIADGP